MAVGVLEYLGRTLGAQGRQQGSVVPGPGGQRGGPKFSVHYIVLYVLGEVARSDDFVLSRAKAVNGGPVGTKCTSRPKSRKVL